MLASIAGSDLFSPCRKGQGDAPPRPECAPLWHDKLLACLREDVLIVLAGLHAQRLYLARERATTLTDTVRNFEAYLPRFFSLPHPSWRSRGWMKKNLWFENEVLPRLRSEVQARLA